MLTVPILYSKVAFDATKEQVFSFNVIGGDQVISNTLTIRNNLTGEIIYAQNQKTYKFEHILPANTLTNGVYYEASIQTYNLYGDFSTSNSIQFWCYTTPTFVFTNIPSGDVVNNSQFAFEVSYNQIEGELLSNYNFKLYNSSKVLIDSSGVKYVLSETQNTISYTFSSLLNNTNYYISVDGVTQYGTEFSSDLKAIVIQYTTPIAFSNITLTNNCHSGNIIIQSNVQGIFGESHPDDPTYIGDTVDLTQEGHYAKWDKNFNLTENWTLKVWGRSFNTGQSILDLINGDMDYITLVYKNEGNTYWVEMYVQNIGMYGNYQIKSNTTLHPLDTDNLFIYVRKVGSLYDISLEKLTGSVLG